MIDPQDPNFVEKRTEEMIDKAINRVAAETDVPVSLLHRILLKKAHDLMLAVVNLEADDDHAD